MPMNRISCPSCGGSLKVADTVSAGKKIRCPKCETVFAVPGERSSPAVAATPRAKKPAPPPDDFDDLDERDEPPRKRRHDPDADEEDGPARKSVKKRANYDDDDEEVEERRAPRKRKKKRQSALAGNLYLLIGAGVALVGGGIAVAYVYWPKDKTSVVENKLPPDQPPFNFRRAPAGQPQAPAATPENAPAGLKVFTAKCANCHALDNGGGNPGAGGGRRGRGPNLGKVGADPEHTVDWLMAFIRDPKSQRPNSRMRGFDENRLSQADLRTLAEYLASLK